MTWIKRCSKTSHHRRHHHRWIVGQKTTVVHLRTVHPSTSSQTMRNESSKILGKWRSMSQSKLLQLDDEPSVASVGENVYWKFFVTFSKGPPQGPLVFRWGVVLESFDYELTLLRIKHPSTNFDNFLTPKN